MHAKTSMHKRVEFTIELARAAGHVKQMSQTHTDRASGDDREPTKENTEEAAQDTTSPEATGGTVDSLTGARATGDAADHTRRRGTEVGALAGANCKAGDAQTYNWTTSTVS